MSVLWLPSMIDAAALTMSRAVFRSVFILYPVVLQQAGSRNSHTVAQWLQHSRSHIISKPREVSVSSFLYWQKGNFSLPWVLVDNSSHLNSSLGYLSVLEPVAKANRIRYLSVSNQSGSIPLETQGGSHPAQTTRLKNIHSPKSKIWVLF